MRGLTLRIMRKNPLRKKILRRGKKPSCHVVHDKPLKNVQTIQKFIVPQ